MAKILTRSNYRVEVTPTLPHVEETDHKKLVRALDELKREIIRHCDQNSIGIFWDTEEICSFCGYAWETGVKNLPLCCDQAIKEYEQCNKEISHESNTDTSV